MARRDKRVRSPKEDVNIHCTVLCPGSGLSSLGREVEMKKVKRTTLTIQTERLVFMSRSRSLYSLCTKCGDEVRLLTVDEAALLTRVNSRQIYFLLEVGALHCI